MLAAAWRKTYFIFYGTNNFSNKGFKKAKNDMSELEVDLKGRSYLVTGANSGIGFATSKYFASRGGTVHMVCRNKERGEEALKKIVDETKNDDVHLHIYDLGNMTHIRDLATHLATNKTAVDVLVANAGVLLTKRGKMENNMEETFAINTAGTFLLTNLMIPILKKSKDPRVVVVSSGGMLLEPLVLDSEFKDLEPWDGQAAYSRTKRHQVALTERWAELHKDIKFYSVHPGWTETPGVQTSISSFYNFYKDSFRTLEQGSETIWWLSTTDKVGFKESGLFYRDRAEEIKHVPSGGTSYDSIKVDDLWSFCSKLTGWSDAETANIASLLFQSKSEKGAEKKVKNNL